MPTDPHSFAELSIELFNELVKILKAHLFVKRTQNTHYNRLKENVEINEFIIHVDYSESYEDKEQDEIQSASFGHNSFSIFVATHVGLIHDTLFSENVTVHSSVKMSLSHQKLPTILELQHSRALT